jgi:hypothetical protein
VLRGDDYWSVTVAPRDNFESCTSTVAGTVPGGVERRLTAGSRVRFVLVLSAGSVPYS